eukprot:GHVH01010105.1.p1 GENE.GHVH01010105.1~~GHVH01010105.1.p1  ORF type:complete len:352 (-),score=41.41 GHVH01010105.1:1421-2476(-)
MAKSKSLGNPGCAERKKEKARILAKNKHDRLTARLIARVKADPVSFKEEYEKLSDMSLQKRLDPGQKKRWAEIHVLKPHIDAAVELRKQAELIGDDRKELGSFARLAADARDQRRRQTAVAFDMTTPSAKPGGMQQLESSSSESSYSYYSSSNEEEEEEEDELEYSDPLPPPDPCPEVLKLQLPKPANATFSLPQQTTLPISQDELPQKPRVTSIKPNFRPVAVLRNQKVTQKSLASVPSTTELVGLRDETVEDALGSVMSEQSSLSGLSRLKKKMNRPRESSTIPTTQYTTTIPESSIQLPTAAATQQLPASFDSLGLRESSVTPKVSPSKKHVPTEEELNTMFESFLEL